MTDWSAFWLACAVLLILFSGEPDIADAIIHRLGLEPQVTPSATEAAQ